jgi:Tfp pilus assembly protein PilZ
MAPCKRSILIVGTFRDETVGRIREAASAASVEPVFSPTCDQATASIAGASVTAVLLRMDAPGAAGMCAQVRGQARLAEVPILGVAPERSDLAFSELFTNGGDDLVALWTPHPLARRLRALAARPEAAARAASDRSAIVAGADPHWRSVVGRVLYNGGFSVRFASGGSDLSEECMREAVKLVVVADDIEPDGAVAHARRARERGSEAGWVVMAPPKRMPAAHAAARGVARVSVGDGFAPPENVLFLANELLAQRGVDQRASARLLYGTSVTFRAAGRDEDEIGFSYNISAGGLYVRTLAPLEPNQDVWLELWAPRSERRVRLAGTVAWRRPFGANERATVPAGFGVRITDGLAGDLDRWRQGYESLSESLLGSRAEKASAPEL